MLCEKLLCLALGSYLVLAIGAAVLATLPLALLSALLPRPRARVIVLRPRP